MLQLLFTCRCHPSLVDRQITSVQKDVWRRSVDRKLGGFFVRSDGYLVGLFEGRDAAVIGQVEYLIRKHKVESVRVVREAMVETREWGSWNEDVADLAMLTTEQRAQFVGLAQIVKIAVEADRNIGRAH